jgi:predicted ATPase
VAAQAPASPTASEPVHAELPRRNNLLRSVDALIGRGRELAQLQDLIASHRLVTVTGPGGVGKSRLVIEAGWACLDRFADGVWLVELAALADPELVPSAITTALGIDVDPSVDALTELKRQLGDRRLLLILDNCEHVIAAVATVLETTLPAVPNVHALISSQELIGIGGEHVLRLPSLAVPSEDSPSAESALAAGAVQLFVARAQAADPRFVFDDRAAPAATAICRRLDGIPLALEMAAARVPLLGLEALAARLDERFRLLTAGKRTALPRQRTLHATLDWSFGLLSAREQAVFRRLGVFAGSFTLAAAAAVASDGGHDEFSVIESLAGLCDKSLVATDAGGAEVRYRLLETARAYALERLADASETAEVTRRQAMHERAFFERCFDDWTVLSDAAFRARYAPEIDNLRTAIAWSFGPGGDRDTATALIGSSMPLWLSLSLYAEADALVQSALKRLDASAPAAVEAELWFAVANLYGQRNYRESVRAARRAVDLYRGIGDSLRLGCALRVLGGAHAGEGDEEAESVLLEARPLLAASGRPRVRALLHSAFALHHAARGQAVDAIRELQATMDLSRAAGADSGLLRTLGSLADQVWRQGDLEQAIRSTRDALEQHRRSPFSDRLSRIYATANLFGMLVEHGDLAEARAVGRGVLPQLRELNLPHGWSDHFASLLARTGGTEDAVRLVGWADAGRLAKGLRRQPNEQRARETTLALARQSAPAADPGKLLAEGAELTEDEAYRLMMP